MDKKNMTEYIKVNLPLTEQDYLAGNGEGVWVLVDPKTKQAHDTDATGGGYVGILDNDSCYYPGLNAGQLIPFELRGSYRPVANFYSFLSKLTRLTQEGKALLLERIAMNQTGHNRPTDPSDPHYEGPLCCDCQYCGDKYSFPEPNDLILMDPENPILKHFYCCCGDCNLYGKDITGLGIHECEHFEEL